MRELALGLAAAAGLHAALLGGAPSGRRVPTGLSAETAVETAGFLSLGMRRLAADLGLIRMLVYYGSPEDEEDHGHDHGGGHYHELLARARAIRALDPGYDYPVFYAAGALAFNLGRPGEALDLLAEALADDPDNLKLKAYVGAIGFQERGDTARVLALLEPTLADPDCPTMIKMMVALMYRQQKRPKDAIRVYRDVLATSRDDGYRAQARHALSVLQH